MHSKPRRRPARAHDHRRRRRPQAVRQAAPGTVEPVHIVSRIFGARRYTRADPSPADVAAVDVTAMIEHARSRGDVRSDDEILAALLLGADLTADRHPDPELRRRAAAAALATRDRLVDRVGEDEAARLLSSSAGPVGEDGTTARRKRRGRAT
jgi:hypothetical protein